MKTSPTDWMKHAGEALVIAPIRFYRAFISPMFMPVCRFQPTCSEYALDAVRIHGPLRGLALTGRRLLRCHPISWLGGSSGFDPVPPK
ncbi:MAG TPA: membrane protein insertion efficiency factor YidD [Rhizomicrobium sp.]|nr:membrane protein insertion efficiency factor YidD [Rhizomicrobium sp.]